MESEDDESGAVGFIDQVVEVGAVKRVFVDEDRVFVSGADVAQGEDLLRGAVQPVDLAHGDAVAVENLAHGLAFADFGGFEAVVVGIDAVDQVASGFRLLLGGAVAGSRRQREQCEEV